jgi:hypothetical protein
MYRVKLRNCLTVVSLLLMLVAVPGWGMDWASFELRYTGSRLTPSDDLQHDRFSGYAEREQPLFSLSDGFITGSAKASLLGDIDHVDPTRELRFRELYFDLLAGNFSLRAGLQDVPWSETFGFFIADVVNPRDLRDPLYLDPRYARLPVAALKSQWTIDGITVQGVLTPVTHNTLYQSSFAGIPVLPAPSIETHNYPHDLEAGGRIESLLFDKLDTSLFYYRHLNRNFAAEEVPTDAGPALQTVAQKVDSYGVTSSYALESVVFREDFVFTPDQPTSAQDLGAVRRSNEVQSMLGVDYSSTDDFSIGLQYQYETHPGAFHWLSAKVSKKFGAQNLQPELFVFHGIGNRDLWIEPQISWYANDRLTLSLRYDYVDAKEQSSGDFTGYLSPIRDDDRVLAEVTFKF